MKRQAILVKYMVFLLGCGLVLAGFTSWLANPTDMQVVFSVLATALGALLVTLGLSKPPTETIDKEKTSDEKLAADVIAEEDDKIDFHNDFHSVSDIYENEKEAAKND